MTLNGHSALCENAVACVQLEWFLSENYSNLCLLLSASSPPPHTTISANFVKRFIVRELPVAPGANNPFLCTCLLSEKTRFLYGLWKPSIPSPLSKNFSCPLSLFIRLALSHLLNKHALVTIPLKNKTNPKQTKLSLAPTASAPNKCIFSFCDKTLQKSCPHSVSNLVLLLALQPLWRHRR